MARRYFVPDKPTTGPERRGGRRGLAARMRAAGTAAGDHWRSAPTMLRDELLVAVADYLNAEGIENSPTNVPHDRKGKKSEAAIEIVSQPINSIWIEDVTVDPDEGRKAACRFRVNLDRPLTKESEMALRALSQVIRERKILRTLLTLGNKKGDVLEVSWSGGRIAESLNGDIDLSTMLVEYADAPFFSDDWITLLPEAEPGSWVDIESPPFSDVPEAEALPSAVPFELYCRIARHIRDTAIV